MKIEINYLRNSKLLGTKVEVTLNECAPASLIPAYRIINGNQKIYLYRYDGKIWMEYPHMTQEKFVFELHYGLFNQLHYDKPVDNEWMATWLKASNKLYQVAEEPFYYLETNHGHPNDMVRASWETNGFLEVQRHYAPHERQKAMNCATQIHNMVHIPGYNPKPVYPEAIIEALNPDGTAKTLLEKRQFQCKHCRAVKFADQAILLDHLQDYHADLLDEAGFPEEATEEDVIGDNFTEVFYEEDILSDDEPEVKPARRREFQCWHCLKLLADDETALREHIRTEHPNVHASMNLPFITTDAFISMNFYEVMPEKTQKFRCKHCGHIFNYDEEAIWGHLQMAHPDLFEEDQNLETPDMLETHWEHIT